jgi:uncharacterized delta-60 repeat protein
MRSRAAVVCAAIGLLLGGCSSILGLTAPQGTSDGGGDGNSGAPDFALSVTPARPRVPQNGSDFLTVGVIRTNLTASIDVNIPAPPPGVTVVPVTLDAGSDSGVLLLSGASSLMVGSDLPLELVATSGALTHKLDITAVVTFKPGIPDPGFATAGTFTLSLNGGESFFDDEFYDVALAPDGTLTAAGNTGNSLGGGNGVMVRLTDTGAPDPTFDGGQILQLRGSSGSSPAFFFADARQSDGHVVGGGEAKDPFGSNGGHFPAAWAASVTGSGVEDKNFGDVEDDFFDAQVAVEAVAAQTGDALVMVAGDGPPSSAGATVIFRQIPSGTADGTYNNGALLPLGITFAGAAALALDPTATTAYVAGTGSAGAQVLHLTSVGAVDATFGTNGVVLLAPLGSAATAIAVQPDGKLIVGGPPQFVARLLPNGSFDTTFGNAGVAAIAPMTFTSLDAVAVQSDGRIVIAGRTPTTPGTATIMRLLADGSVNPTYGTGGLATLTLGTNAGVHNLRLQPDDSALLCGTGGSSPNGADGVLMRVTP